MIQSDVVARTKKNNNNPLGLLVAKPAVLEEGHRQGALKGSIGALAAAMAERSCSILNSFKCGLH